MNNNEKNNQNNQNNQNNNQGKPVSAHPDPVTPNQSNGITDEKNKTAPVSGHPDPVVPNVKKKSNTTNINMTKTMMLINLLPMICQNLVDIHLVDQFHPMRHNLQLNMERKSI